jgi:recombination protein RecT
VSRQSVRGQVAKATQAEVSLDGVRQRVRDARNWFNTVVPSHVDAEQFVALGLGQLNKDPQLAEAAVANPGSFMLALSECARLGLIPGETYHLVVFRDNQKHTLVVTGIVDYKGEIDMIYRAGGVNAIFCSVVRAKDHFSWRPGMDAPVHYTGTNEHGQEGLANDEDRGPLTGAYAYARLTDGSLSAPIVMPLSEIKKHEDAARSKKFWQGIWRDDMFLKTVLHKLFDRVPHSPEYLRERLRAESAALPPGVTQQDVEAATEVPAIAPVPAMAEPGGKTVDVGGRGGQGYPVADDAPATSEQLNKILASLDHFKVRPADRLHVACVITDRVLGALTDLTANEADQVVASLEGLAKNTEGRDHVALFQETLGLMERRQRGAASE